MYTKPPLLFAHTPNIIISVCLLCACVIAHTGTRVMRRTAIIQVGGDNTGMTIGLRKDDGTDCVLVYWNDNWSNDGGTENKLERQW